MKPIILSEFYKTNFIDTFRPPVIEMVNNNLIENPYVNGPYSKEAKVVKDKQRNMLDNGRANFDVSGNRLSPSQRIDLYCFYYFQMHFTSSVAFYMKSVDYLRTKSTSKEICFIDVGCGPFTSGLAFEGIMRKYDRLDAQSATYIGIDISQNMIEKGKNISEQMLRGGITGTTFNTDKDLVTDGLHLMVKDINNVLYVLNYSYLFASHSIDVADFISFTDTIYHQFCKNTSSDMLILHQNPKKSDLNQKWKDYKDGLSYMESASNFPNVLPFSFNDVLESCKYQPPKFEVYCDVLQTKK